jgi:hypothetical protein
MAEAGWENHEGECEARGYDVALDGDVGNWALLTDANEKVALQAARSCARGMHLSTDAVEEAGHDALLLAVQKFSPGPRATLQTWLTDQLKFRMLDLYHQPEEDLPSSVDTPVDQGDDEDQAIPVPLVLQAKPFVDGQRSFTQFWMDNQISERSFESLEAMSRTERAVTLERDPVRLVSHDDGPATLVPVRTYEDIGAERGMTKQGAMAAHGRARRKAAQAI